MYPNKNITELKYRAKPMLGLLALAPWKGLKSRPTMGVDGFVTTRQDKRNKIDKISQTIWQLKLFKTFYNLMQ